MGSFLGGRAGLLLAISFFSSATGQVVSISDDFNDENDVGWTHYAPISTPPYNGEADWSFPADGVGFGYRIYGGPAETQEPQYVGPARVGSFHTDAVFSEFSEGLDLLTFDPILESVGFLAGRITTPGLLTTRGYLVGYIHQGLNANQSAFFTLAFDSELTITTPDYYTGGLALMPNLDPSNGRYRMIFTGSGPNLKGAIYNRTDLLEPLVRIAAFDATHANGNLGLGVLNLNDYRATDYTFDNYAASTNANAAPGFPGVAQVVGLTPAPNTFFYSPTGGITFRVRTFTMNPIATNSIRLFVNGTNLSAQLSITDQSVLLLDPTSHYLCRYAGPLPSNAIVRATIIANDTSGKGTTNNWTFDTFTTNGAMIVEAEDYNFGSGQFIDNPPVSGLNSNGTTVGAAGYYNRTGTLDVDFFETQTSFNSAENNQYRPESVGTAQDRRDTRDTPRADHLAAGVGDYQVWQMQAGEWLNYTRTFPTGRFNIYLRASSQAPRALRCDEVTGNRTLPNQTKAIRGVFTLPNTGSSTRFRYLPLGDAFGNPQAISLGGVQTLRLTALSANDDVQLNYLLLVPASAGARPPWVVSVSPSPGATNGDPQQLVEAVILNADAQVVTNTIQLRFDGSNMTGVTILGSTSEGAGATVRFRPATMLLPNSQHSVELVFGDSNGLLQTNQWSFTVANLLTLPPSIVRPAATGPRGFNGRIHKARNDASPADFPNSSARAEAQLAGTMIDPIDSQPYFNEAGGPNEDGTFFEPATLNYEQAAGPAGFFASDRAFPNIDPALYVYDPNFIAMAATTYLELAPGVYRFGVRSDDGFKLTAGFTPLAQSLMLGAFEGGRPSSETEFDFFVLSNGFYSFRLIYYEGNGGADLEWYSVDRITGVRTLINAAGGIKAYADAGYRLNLSPGTTNVVLSFSTTPTRPYAVEYKNSLSNSTWNVLGTGTGSGGPVTLSAPRTNAARFFRLRVD
jgi:hypothetical protein